MEPYLCYFVFIFGAIIGSFLSVCIYRIPLSREDIREEILEAGEEVPLPENIKADGKLGIGYPKRSFCPSCGAQLEWYHNVPLLSWLFLRGKCAFCKTRIPFRYFLVELLTGLSAYLAYTYWGLTIEGILVFIFLASLIVMSFIDIDYYILPDIITLPGTTIGLVFAGINEYTGFLGEPFSSGALDALFGVLAGGGVLFLVSEVYFRIRKIDGLGMGDVKLLAMVGALFGPEAAIYTIMIGSIIGTIFGVTIIVLKGKDFSYHLPFGPYLAVATVLFLFTGFELVAVITDGIQSFVNYLV